MIRKTTTFVITTGFTFIGLPGIVQATITPVSPFSPYSSVKNSFQLGFNPAVGFNHDVPSFTDSGSNTNGGVSMNWNLNQTSLDFNSAFSLSANDQGDVSIWIRLLLTETTDFVSYGALNTTSAGGASWINTQFYDSTNYVADNNFSATGNVGYTYGTYTGTLAPGEYAFVCQYTLTAFESSSLTGTGSYHVDFTEHVLPEPTSLALIALGVPALLMRRRRRV